MESTDHSVHQGVHRGLGRLNTATGDLDAARFHFAHDVCVTSSSLARNVLSTLSIFHCSVTLYAFWEATWCHNSAQVPALRSQMNLCKYFLNLREIRTAWWWTLLIPQDMHYFCSFCVMYAHRHWKSRWKLHMKIQWRKKLISQISFQIYFACEAYGLDTPPTCAGYFLLANVFAKQEKIPIAHSMYSKVTENWWDEAWGNFAESVFVDVSLGLSYIAHIVGGNNLALPFYQTPRDPPPKSWHGVGALSWYVLSSNMHTLNVI